MTSGDRNSIHAYVSFDYLHITLGIEALIAYSWLVTLSQANDKPNGNACRDNIRDTNDIRDTKRENYIEIGSKESNQVEKEREKE